MLGLRYGVLTLMIWGASVAFLGVFMAVPLRKHFLVDAPLRFRPGSATAETIRSMFADATRAKEQITTLIRAAAAASALTVLTWAVPWILRPPLVAAFGIAQAAAAIGGTPFASTPRSSAAGSSWAFASVYPSSWARGSPTVSSRRTPNPEDGSRAIRSTCGGARGCSSGPAWRRWLRDSLAQLAAALAPALASRWRRRARRKRESSFLERARGGRRRRKRATVTPRGARPRHHRHGGSVLSRRRRRRARLFFLVDDHSDAIPQRWWVVGLTATSVATAWSLTSSFGVALAEAPRRFPRPSRGYELNVAVRDAPATADINPVGPWERSSSSCSRSSRPGTS